MHGFSSQYQVSRLLQQAKKALTTVKEDISPIGFYIRTTAHTVAGLGNGFVLNDQNERFYLTLAGPLSSQGKRILSISMSQSQ